MNRKQRRANLSGSPKHSAAFVNAFNQALKLHQAGELDKAEVAYRRAMALNPSDAMIHNNFGVVLHAKGRREEAVECQIKAIKLDPNLALAHNNLGVSLNALERHEEAVKAFARAIELNPNNPEAINNLGDSQVKLGRFEEGVATLCRALAMVPNYVEAHSNLGTGYWGLGQLDKAIASLRQAIALQPNLAMAHKNLGIVLLLKGDYAEGWKEYDWRWLSDGFSLRKFPLPIWSGAPLEGKKLLVWAEQGIGDEILQASMMGDLVAHGLNVLWECDARLAPLLQRSCPALRVIGRTDPPSSETEPDVAAHIPAASLGQHLRRSIERFPPDRRRYLIADKERAAKIRASLGLAVGEKLVGMSWLSKNFAFGASKSTALSDWAEIFRTPGVRFVDLQYGDTAAERAELQNNFGLALSHVEGLDLRDDIDGLAALISACDLVVTVSNTTAHIAGGLGVPVYVLIPAGMGKFWYWGLDGDSTPWYPSASLIRQKNHGDWNEALATLAQRVRSFAAG